MASSRTTRCSTSSWPVRRASEPTMEEVAVEHASTLRTSTPPGSRQPRCIPRGPAGHAGRRARPRRDQVPARADHGGRCPTRTHQRRVQVDLGRVRLRREHDHRVPRSRKENAAAADARAAHLKQTAEEYYFDVEYYFDDDDDM